MTVARAAIACLLVVRLGSAHADDTPAAPAPGDAFDVQVAAAQSRYLAHDYQGAIALLEEAYRLKPVARLLFNLGQAHRKLGHRLLALGFFERYRVARGTTDADVPVDRYIDELRRELAAGEPETAPPPATTTPPPATTTPPAAPAPAATVARMVTRPAPAAPPAEQRHLWPWVAAAVGVVAATGVVLWLANRPAAPLSATLGDFGPGATKAFAPLARW